MATTTATAPAIDEPRVVLHGVRWEAYEAVLAALDGCHARITYDRGAIEIMSPSPEHEGFAEAFNLLINELALECGVRHLPRGITTFRKRAQARGREPDRCYYFAQWRTVAGKKRIHLDDDPPPDLAIEIETMHPVSIDRMAIYASLGVPEVWRFDGRKLAIGILVDDRYEARERSPIFPAIPPEGLASFVVRGVDEPWLDWADEFRAWVRERLMGA